METQDEKRQAQKTAGSERRSSKGTPGEGKPSEEKETAGTGKGKPSKGDQTKAAPRATNQKATSSGPKSGTGDEISGTRKEKQAKDASQAKDRMASGKSSSDDDEDRV